MIAGHAAQNDRSKNRINGVKRSIATKKDAQLLTVIETDYTLNAGGNAFEEIMSKQLQPTAIICGNDVLAAGVIVRARELGIAIPGEVSVTGFDDISLATAVYPALTTVRVPQLEMGKTAARVMLELLNKGSSVSYELETLAI